MSVRAYKIIKIEIAEDPTFNCWHDDDIFAISESGRYDDGGTLTFFKPDVEELLAELEARTKDGMDEEHWEHLQTQIENTKKLLRDFDPEEDYVSYDCF